MFPSQCPKEIDGRRVPTAEADMFQVLEEQLPDDEYQAFFSVHLQPSRKPRTGEIDFCLVHRERGILVIEVKGGVVSYDGGKSGTTDKSGRFHHHKMTPEAQVERTSHILRGGIENLSRWSGRKLEVGWMVAFPETELDQPFESAALPPELALYSSDMDNLPAKIDGAYNYWGRKASGGLALNGFEHELVTNYIQPSSKAQRRTLRRELDSIENDEIDLTPVQLTTLVQLRSRSRIEVCGGAGTGKTVVALEHARWLADSGRKTLITCYNLLLGKYLEQQVEGHENLTAMAWETFCRRSIERAGVSFSSVPPNDPAAITPYYDELMPRALQDAYLGDTDLDYYDAILVDEAQDFRLGWLTEGLELALKAQTDSVFCMFRDPQQGIFRKPDDLPGDFEEVPMVVNERNTKEIHEFGGRFNERSSDTFVGDRDGRPVEILEAGTPRDLQKQLSRVLHRLVEDEGIDPYDIAVLSGGNRERGPLANVEQVGNFTLTDDFFAGGSKQIFFDSIHRFKGLEKLVIILIDLGKHLAEDKARESVIYVGATRAKGHLVVIESAEVIAKLKE